MWRTMDYCLTCGKEVKADIGYDSIGRCTNQDCEKVNVPVNIGD